MTILVIAYLAVVLLQLELLRRVARSYRLQRANDKAMIQRLADLGEQVRNIYFTAEERDLLGIEHPKMPDLPNLKPMCKKSHPWAAAPPSEARSVQNARWDNPDAKWATRICAECGTRQVRTPEGWQPD